MSRIPTKPTDFSGDSEGMLAAVAELYYKDGLTQAQIGKRLGLSRQTIVSYLRQGKKRGIVEIKISNPPKRNTAARIAASAAPALVMLAA